MSKCKDEYTDKVILITGAASGIGLALARELARRQAKLILADIDADRLRRISDELDTRAGGVWSLPVDVTRAEAVAQLAQSAFALAGRVDALVNCAGIYPVTPVLEMSVDEWDRVLNTNLRGPFLLTQAIARRMAAHHIAGVIINISSTASQLARPGIAHYGASKAALNQLTRILAIELATHHIRVNAVLPGVIATETVQALIQTPAGQREHQGKLAKIPLKRLGTTQDVVNQVMFLLSEQSAYCTGSLFTVDGGFTLGIPVSED
jgi:NAD(P)-dependent dehydrogenase (short-subunit alcohol dehydrogenase family)